MAAPLPFPPCYIAFLYGRVRLNTQEARDSQRKTWEEIFQKNPSSFQAKIVENLGSLPPAIFFPHPDDIPPSLRFLTVFVGPHQAAIRRKTEESPWELARNCTDICCYTLSRKGREQPRNPPPEEPGTYGGPLFALRHTTLRPFLPSPSLYDESARAGRIENERTSWYS